MNDLGAVVEIVDRQIQVEVEVVLPMKQACHYIESFWILDVCTVS